MLFTPNELRTFLAECKATIAEINYAQAVVDDSQMANLLQAIAIDENLLLFGVIPDYTADSRDQDGVMFENGFDLLLVKKTQDNNQTQNDFLDTMNECLMVVRALITFIFQKKLNNNCGVFYYLNEGSFQISPVWKKSGTDGWMISFNLRTDL
jgi:hypothetical protein